MPTPDPEFPIVFEQVDIDTKQVSYLDVRAVNAGQTGFPIIYPQVNMKTKETWFYEAVYNGLIPPFFPA